MLWYSHVPEKTVHVRSAHVAFGEPVVPAVVRVVVKSQTVLKRQATAIHAMMSYGELFAKRSATMVSTITLSVQAMIVSGTRA